MKSLIKSTIEVRVSTEEEATAYKNELLQGEDAGQYTVNSFNWALKQVKAQGEIVEEYYQVKYCLVFNDIKAPENTLGEITYEVF